MNFQETAKRLNEQGFFQHAAIVSESVTEYRFNNGLDIIRVFQDNATGICNLEA